jgi:enamine deaminase RidA (YjgF/YER057c/UK114 family)
MSTWDDALQVEDFWYPEALGTLGVFPTGTRVGPLLFLSAQLPRDPATGAFVKTLWDLPEQAQKALATQLEHRDGREGPAQAQTWTIYQNLQKILQSQGSSLDHVIKQRIYVLSADDVEPVEATMLRFFPAQKPATLICATSPVGFHQDLRVQVEVIAAVPSKGAPQPQPVHLPELEPVTRPYPQAVRYGGLIFFSGIQGINPATGRLGMRFSELAPTAQDALVHNWMNSDSGAEKLRTQIAFGLAHLKAVMEHEGGTIESLVRQNFFTTINMKSWGAGTLGYRATVYPGKSAAPTTTAVSVPAVNENPDATFVTDPIGLLPGPWERQAGVDTDLDMSHLPMTVIAGPLVFTTGYVGMDKNLHGPVTRLDQLRDSGRLLGADQFHMNETIVAQAWLIYSAVSRMLEGAGASIGRVVLQKVLMRDASQYPTVERVARIFFGGRLPPTTVMGCSDIGPYPGLEFEVETIALRDG